MTALVSVMLAFTPLASSAIITWRLVGVTFAKGETANGWFQVDTNACGKGCPGIVAWNLIFGGLPSIDPASLVGTSATANYGPGGSAVGFDDLYAGGITSSAYPEGNGTGNPFVFMVLNGPSIPLYSVGSYVDPLIANVSESSIFYGQIGCVEAEAGVCTAPLTTSALVAGTLVQCVNINVLPYPSGPASGDGHPTAITASFTPTDQNESVMTLDAAAKACGFASFDWVQTIDQHPAGPWTYAEIEQPYPAAPTVPYGTADPPLGGYPYDPPLGGYTYEYTTSTVKHWPNFAVAYPFYYSPLDTPTALATSGLPITSADDYALSFHDTPSNTSCGSTVANCLAFTTQLVGVVPCTPLSSSLCNVSGFTPSVPLFQWKWKSNFNGSHKDSSGGVYNINETSSFDPAAPGSGTGGVTITNINGLQLPASVPPNQATVTASGLAYSRVSQTFNGTVTLTNISSSAISGPLQIVFFGMPVGVTLANATSNLSGTPYMTVPTLTSLAPGESTTVSVRFKNSSNATINFTPAVYSGSIN